jgi:dynein heavy chain
MLPVQDRAKLSKEMVELCDGNHPRFMSEEETFFEYFVDEGNSEWIHWNTKVPTWEYPTSEEKPRFARLIIPTLDSVRLESLLGLVTSAGHCCVSACTVHRCTSEIMTGELAHNILVILEVATV